MREALVQAKLAAAAGEVPVGAVVAKGEEIIARAHNQVEGRKSSAAHAELLAIEQAQQHLGNWRLSDCILCVTLEPCTMCAGAIALSRIPLVVFAAEDSRQGAFGSIYDLQPQLSPELRLIRGVQSEAAEKLLKDFFADKR